MATGRGGVDVPVSATWNGRALKQAESQLGSFKKSFGRAFAGIGAAAGAALGVNALGDALAGMASAAAEDQKSVVALSKAMTNIGLGAATAQAEAFIEQMMLATGVADDQLRPAFQKLATASGSLEAAQQGLTLGLDLQAAGYGDLGTVTKALSAAYAGNTTALSRLKLPLDATVLASKDMTKITGELTKLVGGQAAAAANTYAGQLSRLQAAAGEAGETVGYELLRSMENVGNQLGGVGGFTSMITSAGDAAAGFAAGLGNAAVQSAELGKSLVANIPGVDETKTSFGDVLLTVGKLVPGLGLVVTTTEGLIKTGQEEIRIQSELTDELNRSAVMRDIYSGNVRDSTSALDADTESTKRNVTIKERLIRAEETLNGFNRGIIGANIRLAQMRDEGVDPMSDGKKGTSARDRKSFGLDYAAAISDKYELLIGEGKFKKADNLLDSGRAYLGAQVSAKFANRVLGTPAALTDEIDRRDSARGAETYRKTTAAVYNTFNFGDLKVESPADAAEQAKKAARLRALSNRGANAALSGGGIDWADVARREASS